jgi:K+-transporting ATPase ATPase C chain
MSEPVDVATEEQHEPPSPSWLGELGRQMGPALVSVLLLTVTTGIAYPLVLSALAVPLFRTQADGSLATRDDRVIGSTLLGQNLTRWGYFHPRPSAAGNGYDATASGGTNLGPSNPKLLDGAPVTAAGEAAFPGVRQLAEEYRRCNELPTDAAIPIDAVTRSGSGLDPHISPENAALQVGRVARARGLDKDTVRRLVTENTEGRQLGFLGQPRVCVLTLNLALDCLAPLPSAPSPR